MEKKQNLLKIVTQNKDKMFDNITLMVDGKPTHFENPKVVSLLVDGVKVLHLRLE